MSWFNLTKDKAKIKIWNMDTYFFMGVKVFIAVLILTGLIASALIIHYEKGEGIYKAIALLMMVVWACIFIRYFIWAVYFYNVNYGIMDEEWEKIKEGDTSIKEPANNPYRDQTFGLPPGTVRGMIAFTLLFGAFGMLIYALGEDFQIPANSYFWDQMEFFKTAFLMMIAFYFGSRSLKYLQSRSGIKTTGKGLSQSGDEHEASEPDVEEEEEEEEEKSTSGASGSKRISGKSKLIKIPATLDLLKSNLNKSMSETDKDEPASKEKKTVSGEEKKEEEESGSSEKPIVIIDAGHGGIDENGTYTTGNKKQYTFSIEGEEEWTIYEGEINRSIGKLLIKRLEKLKIPYKNLTVDTVEDTSRMQRVKEVNDFYAKNNNCYLLSIHSNSASKAIKGKGTTAHGFEVWTDRGQNKSDALATIAAKWYKKDFSDYRFRQDMTDGDEDKEKDYTVLAESKCPSFLVENLFFDNPEEATFLLSPEGQNRIAHCLANIVQEIHTKGINATA